MRSRDALCVTCTLCVALSIEETIIFGVDYKWARSETRFLPFTDTGLRCKFEFTLRFRCIVDALLSQRERLEHSLHIKVRYIKVQQGRCALNTRLIELAYMKYIMSVSIMLDRILNITKYENSRSP